MCIYELELFQMVNWRFFFFSFNFYLHVLRIGFENEISYWPYCGGETIMVHIVCSG